MEKTVLPSEKEDLKDLTSQLPDELLIYILSFLNVKEALRTSLLSHRWKHLWPFFTGSLDFRHPDTMSMWETMWENKTKFKSARYYFVVRVNRILKLHRASTIDEFRVCFPLDQIFRHDFDRWIDFAMSKGVKRFELDFTPTWACRSEWRYTFPHECIKTSVGAYCIKSLTSFTLMYVHVTDELLEHFLSNCPLLERLHVTESKDIVSLKVCGSSLKLKYLHIIECNNFKSIEIFAPNLESFGHAGKRIDLHIYYAPRLLHVHIGGQRGIPVTYAFCPLSNYLSQLESLSLDIHIFGNDTLEFPKFQTLTNLRHLKWRVYVDDGRSLIGLISLIEAAPFLHKFTLEIFWYTIRIERELRKVMKYPNEHLKELEIVGFVGRAIDIELIVYLLESATHLEKIVINPRSPSIVGTPWEIEATEKNEGATECAKQLKKILPLGAELVIV